MKCTADFLCVAILSICCEFTAVCRADDGPVAQEQPAASAPAASASAAVPDGDQASERLFTLKVLPLLKARCAGCHGDDPKDIRGDLDVRSLAGLLAGGESGEPAVIPGHPADSLLYQAVMWNGLEMPPKATDRLSAEQIELIRSWIAQGAVWPDAKTQQKYRDEERAVVANGEGVLIRTSGGESADWTDRRYQVADIWAFQPLKSEAAHLAKVGSPSRQIDAFIEQKMQAAGLQPAPRASAATLIRRATFDLTGLPPAPEEILQFETEWQHDAETAWNNLLDRLLASPRYGEHWGRHWLDVTRYADTGGMSNDFERSNMWRYRDYVIRAFNNDKPYDEFVVEQLAGDELADASVRERTGSQSAVHETQLSGDYTSEEAEWIVATGFLRTGPWDNAMIDAAEARQIYLDDLVNITGQTFLSTTMRCCKCHDHKFDPLPTRDYYRLYAAFATTQMAERPVPFLPEENQERFDERRAHVERMLAYAVAEKNKLIDKREAAAREWFDAHGLPYQDEHGRKDLPDEQKPPRHVGLDHIEQGQLKVREQDEWIWQRRLERFAPMAQSVFNAEAINLAWNGARKLRIDRSVRNSAPVKSYILAGGNLTATGDLVQPGVLSAVGLPLDGASLRDDPYVISSATDGRRLQLARWIAHPGNALATRSIVNRVWQYHFGYGIARNSNNFGAKGAPPSHPELLDFLAADFVQHGWHIKRLHRLIMQSDTYQRASISPDAGQTALADPDNLLLSYFPRRRLTAEEIRDSLLAVTGELVHASGGLPVMPEINMEVALQPRMLQFSLAPAYQPSPQPELRNRRTVYAYHVRGQADPFTELFNQPNPNESCELRESAAVTPQVFTLLNSDLVTDRSIAFALRLQNESNELDEQIERAFRLALGRSIRPAERDAMRAYVDDMQRYHQSVTPAPAVYPTRIVRSLVEEFSGQPFEYEEILPGFENYQPDVKPADVSPSVRALADMCLLLINTNEFLYVN